MMSLSEQVKTFLEAEGFTVGQRRDLCVGTRRTIGEDMEYYFVWVPENYKPESFAPLEPSFLNRFEEISTSNPTAARFMVVPTTEGMSNSFRDGARRWYRVNIRTSVQFFDTNFKWDSDRNAASAARLVRDKGESNQRLRVAQPYERKDIEDEGSDLLETLKRQLVDFHEKSIHIVIGPAGIGKSYLYETLFAELHRLFLDYKLKGGPRSPRPFPLIPEYLPLADGQTVRSLLSAYLQTDFARPLSQSVFEWMLTNGFAVWMLDGLDEIIAQDPQFFDFLLDLMTLPNLETKPKVLICVRDSLLTTNEALREFSEEYPNDVAIYHLSKWKMPSKQRFAQLTLHSKANDFINVLRKRPSLDDLASVPYYCNLLIEEFNQGRIDEDFSESSLLKRTIVSLIERDYEKGFISKSILKLDEVLSFLEAVASENFAGGLKGLHRDIIQEWGRMVLPGTLAEDDIEQMSSQMVNLATFSQASPGFIRFSQEILEQYLLSRYFIQLLHTSPEVLVRELARQELPADGLTLHLMAESIQEDSLFVKLKGLIYQSVNYGNAFKNVVRVAILCPPDPSSLQDISFERQDLSGLHFNKLSFDKTSFRGCNLTNTEFDGCSLRESDFSEAIIRNTGFLSLPTNGLHKAEIGDLTKFFSMKVNRSKMIDSHEEAHKWFQRQTGQSSPMVSPCKATLQLRYLFNKLVYPDGRARRSWLDRRGMLAGRRLHESPNDVLSAAIRHGYLREEEKFRDRIYRPDGDTYSELVNFVTTLKMTGGIRAVIDDCCHRDNCIHIPTIDTKAS